MYCLILRRRRDEAQMRQIRVFLSRLFLKFLHVRYLKFGQAVSPGGQTVNSGDERYCGWLAERAECMLPGSDLLAGLAAVVT